MTTTYLNHLEKLCEGATEFLKEIDTQDNRGTAKPILIELQTLRYVAADARNAQHTAKAKDCKWLTMAPEDLGLDPEEEIAWNEEWEPQAVFFTYKGLKEHLELNGHNYRRSPDRRDYVKHAWRNPEMVRVHQWVAALPRLISALRLSLEALDPKLMPCSACPYRPAGVSDDTKREWLSDEPNGHPCQQNDEVSCGGAIQFKALAAIEKELGQ